MRGKALLFFFLSSSFAHAIETVTVTADRRERGTFATPRAITVVTDVEQHMPRSLPEALRFETGVAVQQTTPGQGSPYVRGMTGREVLHLVDGVRLNTALLRSGPNQYLALVDPYAAQRIEVVRGSSSVLHGSDALGGVVHVLTPLPQYDVTRLRALQSLAYNGWSTVSRASIDHGEERWAFSAGVTLVRSGDIDPGGDRRHFVPGELARTSSIQERTGYRTYAANVTGRLALADDVELVVRGQLFDAPDVRRNDRLTPRFKRTTPNDVESFFDDQRAMTSLQLRVKDLAATVSWQRITDDVTTRAFPAGARRSEKNRSDALGLTLQNTSRAGAFTFVYGGDAYLDTVSSNTRYPDGSTYNLYGVFGQVEIAPLSRLRLLAGVRSSLFDITVKPRASDPGFAKTFFDVAFSSGAHWEVAHGLALVGNVGRGVRAPSLDDFANLGPRDSARFEVPNPNITPESTWSFDAGIKLRERHASVEGFLFYTRYTDKITVMPTTVNGQANAPGGEAYFHSVNASRVDIRGAELQARVGDREGLFGNLTLMQGDQYEPAHPADRIPPATALAGGWITPIERLRLEAFVWMRGAQRRLAPNNERDNRIPVGGTTGFVTLHARASWMATRSVSLRLAMDNLTDTLVLEHGSGFYARGLDVILSLEARN